MVLAGKRSKCKVGQGNEEKLSTMKVLSQQGIKIQDRLGNVQVLRDNFWVQCKEPCRFALQGKPTGTYLQCAACTQILSTPSFTLNCPYLLRGTASFAICFAVLPLKEAWAAGITCAGQAKCSAAGTEQDRTRCFQCRQQPAKLKRMQPLTAARVWFCSSSCSSGVEGPAPNCPSSFFRSSTKTA